MKTKGWLARAAEADEVWRAAAMEKGSDAGGLCPAYAHARPNLMQKTPPGRVPPSGVPQLQNPQQDGKSHRSWPLKAI